METIENNEQDSLISNVDKQIKIYTEEEHLSKASDELKELYNKFRNVIAEWDNIEVEAKKLYIAFKGARNIADVVVQSKSLKIFINLRAGELDDPKELVRNISEVGHWGNGDYEIIISDDTNFEYIMSLIKQSWIKNKK
jgi:predicted transport protein